MTIALDPNETFDLVLAEDEGEPEGERPTFVFRYLTARQFRELEAANDKLADSETAGESIDLLCGAIGQHLATWRNMVDEEGNPLPFNLADLDRVTSVADLHELMIEVPARSQASQMEKKTSVWRSRSSTDASTKTASPGDAPTQPEKST